MSFRVNLISDLRPDTEDIKLVKMSDKIYISQSKLEQLWESVEAYDEAFATYFEIDSSIPFAPKMELKENVVVTKDEGIATLGVGDKVLDLVNNKTRKKRLKRYNNFVLKHPSFPRIVSEGDSWFQHPMITDTIDYLSKYYPVFSAGAAGDTLRGMHASADWMESLEEVELSAFLISAGGNDILGEQFPGFLNDYSPGKAGVDPMRFLNQHFTKEIETLKQLFQDIVEQVAMRYPGLPILTHGYDHIIPNNKNVPNKWHQSRDKSWIGRYLDERGIIDPIDQRATIVHIIGIFNDNLADLEDRYSHLHYIDLRGTIGETQWYDEIHPIAEGYQQIEIKFLRRLREILT